MSGYSFHKNIVFFCQRIFFTFTNSVDSDEMQHYAAFHLGLHCLQKYLFRGFPNIKDESTSKKLFLENMSAQVTCCLYLLILLTNVSIEANSVDPNQTAPYLHCLTKKFYKTFQHTTKNRQLLLRLVL